MKFQAVRKAASHWRIFFMLRLAVPTLGISQMIITPAHPIQASSGLVADAYRQADELRKQGKNDEALTAVNKAIRFGSDCGKCFGLRSGIEGNLQMFKEGVADGNLGVQRSKAAGDKAMSAYNKGFNLGGSNRHSEALQAYELSIGFDPAYSLGHFGKGKSFYFLGMWADSLAALQEALKLSPKRGSAWAYLAEDQIFLGDPEAGLESANKAVELAPSDPRSYRARAIAHLWDKNYEAMLEDATRSLELDPSRPQGHLLRGNALLFLGRYSEAAKEYALEPDRKLLEPGPRVNTRIYNCGDTSTEIQTPTTYNGDSLTDCLKRIKENLDAAAQPTKTEAAPKFPFFLPVPQKKK